MGRTGLEIAIIGAAARFPGADHVDDFWRNLLDGVESISFFSDEEIVSSVLDPIEKGHPDHVKAGGLLSDADLFDAEFFGFSPREAQVTDPQHRLLLECAWDTLENAGYDSERYAGDIGVFAGAGLNTYLLNNLYPSPEFLRSVSGLQVMLGSDKDYLREPRLLQAQPARSERHRADGVFHFAGGCPPRMPGADAAASATWRWQAESRLAVPQTAGYLYQEGGISSRTGTAGPSTPKPRGTV